MKPDFFVGLKRRTQENLVEFLGIEAELGSTFCKLAEQTQNPAHRKQLLDDIGKAVKALRHFQEQITDSAVRAEMLTHADRLDEFLAKNSVMQTDKKRRARISDHPSVAR